MRRNLWAIVLFCSIISCKKSVDPVAGNQPIVSEYHEYVIPKGQHYAAGNNIRLLNKKSITFKVRFDSSCIYTTSKTENAGDINKLYGFSDCGGSHQVNSARVGWVWNGREIELYAYCYSESQRESKLLGSVGINKEIELGLVAEAGKYVFSIGGRKESMKRTCSADEGSIYQLFPYFGGDEVAPHDMRIFIKDL